MLPSKIIKKCYSVTSTFIQKQYHLLGDEGEIDITQITLSSGMLGITWKKQYDFFKGNVTNDEITGENTLLDNEEKCLGKFDTHNVYLRQEDLRITKRIL